MTVAKVREMAARESRRVHRLQRACSVLTIWTCLLPFMNSISAPRRALLPVGSELRILVDIYPAILLLILSMISDSPARSRRRDVGVSFFVLLMSYASLVYFATNDSSLARNLVLIALAALALRSCVKRGASVGPGIVCASRAMLVLSLIVLVFWPSWYVNSGVYFLDSGKIVATMPNMQGLLSHPNYSGLFFALAFVVEIALILRFGTSRVRAFFVVLASLGLLGTQARMAILIAALALIVMIRSESGRRRARPTTGIRALLILLSVASFYPLMALVFAGASGTTADFAWLSSVTNRPDLWERIGSVIYLHPLIGSGQGALELARASVMNADVQSVVHAHNQPLTTYLSLGVVGIMLYSAFLLSLLSKVTPTATPTLCGALTVLIGSSVTESPVTPYMTQLGVVALVMLVVFSSEQEDKDRA